MKSKHPKMIILFLFVILNYLSFLQNVYSQEVQGDRHKVEIIEDTTYNFNIGKGLLVDGHSRISRIGSVRTAYEFEFYSPSDSALRGSIKDTIWYGGAACIDFLDLTFDGYLDLRFPIEQDARGEELFHSYIFDPDSKSYHLCRTCEKMPSGISLDTVHKKIKFEGYYWYADEAVMYEGEFSIINKFPVLTKYTDKREPHELDGNNARSKYKKPNKKKK